MATPLGIEALAVVTGALRLLDEKPKPITVRELEAAAKVERSIGKSIRAFLEQEEPAAQGDEPPERDYFKTLDTLSKVRGDAEELERHALVASELPEPMVAGEYSLHFQRVKTFLAAVIPRRSYVTLTGFHPSEPSSIELSAFWRAWEAAEDPRVLLRDMSEGILVSDQVEVARQLYPMLYAVMTQQMMLAMAEKRAKEGEEYEPVGWQEQQIETLLQISRLSPDLAADLQARSRRAEQAERAEEQQGPAQGPQVQDKTIDALQTPVQRIAQR